MDSRFKILPLLPLQNRPFSCKLDASIVSPVHSLFNTEPFPSKKKNIIRIREIKYSEKTRNNMLQVKEIIKGTIIKWKQGDKLGEKTHRAMNCSTGEIFVVKEIGKNKKKMKELIKIRRLEHGNIVKCLDFEQIGETSYFYSEYVSGGTFINLIKYV